MSSASPAPTSSASYQIPPDLLAVPWAYALLTSPTTQVIPDAITRPRHGTTAASLFGSTLHKPAGLREYVTLQTPTDTRTIAVVGTELNGHADIMHGGLVGTLLDEVCGAAVAEPSFTAYLNVTYRQPVRTPGVLMGRAWVRKREGRKVWIDGCLEDGVGGVFAEAESLFVLVRKEKL